MTEECGVEIRLLPLAAGVEELSRLKSFLTEEELQRGNRLLDPERRDRFFAGRGAVREALAQCLGGNPGAIRFVEGEFGKPRVAGEERIRFNVSHAGNHLLLAVADGREVGCDLEQVRQELAFRGMAERYFSEAERGELFSLAPEQQLPAFYRCWTRKEAYLKGTGTGFSHPSTAFDVSLLPQDAPRLRCHRGKPGETGRWRLSDIAAPDGFVAALAVENV